MFYVNVYAWLVQGVKFLFFPIFWPASCFLMKFLVFPIFQGFTRYTETFWNTWNKIANKIDKFY